MLPNFKKVTRIIKGLSINPIYNTNWCDMPAEIKLECIGKMDLNERLSLRCAAKAERSLVDSQKIKFDSLCYFVGREEELNFAHYGDNDKYFDNELKDMNEAVKFVNYMKKVGVFENLSFSLEHPLTDYEHFVCDDGLFTVKTIEFSYCNVDNMIAILRKMRDGVESIEIGLSYVPYWHIYSYRGTDCLHKVAQMWIDRNSKIGSTFQTIADQDDGSFEEYLDHFADRIVSISEKRVRIRTNNSDRHILLELGLDDVITIDYFIQFFRLMVISAEMKESEYDDNCKDWICYIAPEMQVYAYGDQDAHDNGIRTQNLTEKTAKLSIDPIYDTNWCDMPDNIKLECIGKMELNERLSLRCTAKSERSLVDSQKIRFSKGSFRGRNLHTTISLYRDNGQKFYKLIKFDRNEAFKFMKYIWKIGVFETIKFSFDDAFIRHKEFRKYDGFFTTKTLKMKMNNFSSVVSILHKTKSGVESIVINREDDFSLEPPIDKILANTHIQNVPYWQIKYHNRTDSLHKIAQVWIDKNLNVGTTFQVDLYEEGSFDEFWKHLAGRMVSKNERRVRIRTNNPDRHILLERGIDETVGIDYNCQYFRLMVISAKMGESEYEEDCKEWICKMNPYMYDEYDSENSFDDLDDFSDDYFEEFDSWGHMWYDSDDAHQAHNLLFK
ncbi:unnamed protein product [Caenorhabditis nigoni]